MSARCITMPPGTDTRLCIRPPFYCLVAAPAPLRADLDALLDQPNVLGLFTFDRGVDWPDREGCRWATEYLRAGRAIVLQFNSLKDALAAQKSLAASSVTL